MFVSTLTRKKVKDWGCKRRGSIHLLDFKAKTKVGKHADFDVPVCEVDPEREVAPLWVGVWADTNFGLQTGFVKASGDDFFGVFGVGFVVN